MSWPDLSWAETLAGAGVVMEGARLFILPELSSVMVSSHC